MFYVLCIDPQTNLQAKVRNSCSGRLAKLYFETSGSTLLLRMCEFNGYVIEGWLGVYVRHQSVSRLVSQECSYLYA